MCFLILFFEKIGSKIHHIERMAMCVSVKSFKKMFGPFSINLSFRVSCVRTYLFEGLNAYFSCRQESVIKPRKHNQ